MIDLDGDLAEEFLGECTGHLATIEADLLAIEQSGPDVDEQQLVNRIFQNLLSVRGAGVFGLVAIRDLALRMEDALVPVRSRRMALTPQRAGVLLRATDRLQELIQHPGTSNQADIVELMAALARNDEDPPPSAGTDAGSAVECRDRGDRPLRILLVEDDFASRLLLQTFLSRHGECHVAVNGREAVEAFRSALEREQTYDLICMDVMMPEMDGREAVRQVRALEEARGILSTRGSEIIMTTAVDEFREVIRCFQDLCDGYFVKPISLVKLLRQMKSWQLIP
jgi:two-component system chemotaxis response regulator CheY